MTELVAIAAMSRNRVIGANGKLPWHISEDLKRFKELTMGHFCIMGRKTFESLPGPLPGRGNVVLTGDESYKKSVPLGVLVADSLSEAIRNIRAPVGVVFIIGGSSVFSEALPLCSRLYLTEIHEDFEGDTFFPEFGNWEEISRAEQETHYGMRYDFVEYVRSM